METNETQEIEDVAVTCVGCREEFIVPAKEQQWLAEKFGPTYALPKRCRTCRQKRREESGR